MLLIEKLQQADNLINLQITGDLSEFSDKLQMSTGQVQELIDVMKELHAPITFDNSLNSYVYSNPGEFQIGFIRYE